MQLIVPENGLGLYIYYKYPGKTINRHRTQLYNGKHKTPGQCQYRVFKCHKQLKHQACLRNQSG